jgi:hypothetical protein
MNAESRSILLQFYHGDKAGGGSPPPISSRCG